jgi:hypothetical protein
MVTRFCTSDRYAWLSFLTSKSRARTLPLIMIDQIPDPHKGGMQCSAWPGPDQRRAGYGCDGMGWILREGKRRHLLLVGTANPRAAQRNSRWGKALGARSGLCIERGRGHLGRRRRLLRWCGAGGWLLGRIKEPCQLSGGGLKRYL